MELECRQEEEDITVGIDLDTASQKSMAKLVNQVRAGFTASCMLLGFTQITEMIV